MKIYLIKKMVMMNKLNNYEMFIFILIFLYNI